MQSRKAMAIEYFIGSKLSC